MIDKTRVNVVFQYAILLAGDVGELHAYKLGPIHLIKYLYIADLAFAKRNSGDTYTGVDWKFYHFGPWSLDAFNQIETACKGINALVHNFESDYGDEDYVRIEKRDSALLKRIEREIPPTITRTLKRDVKRHLNDTASLLQYVYTSEPMLHAAPNQYLDFSILANKEEKLQEPAPELLESSWSKSKHKKIHSNLKALKERISNEALSVRQLVDPSPTPLYDDVFYSGLEMLEEMEAAPFENQKLVASFDQSVWTSNTRKGIHGKTN